jgi:hypothetical protein
VRHSSKALTALLLLTCVVSAAFGLGACTEPCADPFAACSALCLDCACCPNGVSTPFEIEPPTVANRTSVPAFEAVSPGRLSVPLAEILHVPKSFST